MYRVRENNGARRSMHCAPDRLGTCVNTVPQTRLNPCWILPVGKSKQNQVGSWPAVVAGCAKIRRILPGLTRLAWRLSQRRPRSFADWRPARRIRLPDRCTATAFAGMQFGERLYFTGMQLGHLNPEQAMLAQNARDLLSLD